MKLKNMIFVLLVSLANFYCTTNMDTKNVEIYETSAKGNKMRPIAEGIATNNSIHLELTPEEKYQKITGFGGAFTESSAYLLNQLSLEKRNEIINAYFSDEGARYSLTRTHMNSCDFSLGNYSYAPIAGDTELKHFSVDEDLDDIIPMIKDAMKVSSQGFKILASPWTAPPWMKDNKEWKGGKLLPEYYNTWALFFSKYIEAYKNHGIDIWGFTVENEPLGNGNNWESMHFNPEEMIDFVVNHLKPSLQNNNHQVPILSYDQNRGEELEEWAHAKYRNSETKAAFDGFAIHWYASTFDWFPKSLQTTHMLAPEKYLIQSEACVDAEVPHWNDDKWYWSKEATDWGWDWAPEDQKPMHPKYVPVYRYARDIIGCLNNWVDGWIDWNMVLDTNGGPNWANNWCVAPVIVKPETDEVYFTPLYYTLAHFSKFIRPGAHRIGFKSADKKLMTTAIENPDGTIVVILLNMEHHTKDVQIVFDDREINSKIDAQAIQTIIIKND